jgi:endonuclease G
MKIILLSLFILITSFNLFPQKTAYTTDSTKVILYDNGSWEYDTASSALHNLEIPMLKPTDEVVQHEAYILSYNEKDEQANWVAYELTKDHTVAKFKRSNKFISDPSVKTGSADGADYAGSGYDRGHLAPAGDMAWSKVTLDESFYFSNMSPQVPSFNRGVWKRLETLARKWAKEYQKLYIVTGPVLTSDLPTIGHDSVAVPKYYYKVILEYSPNEKKAIGFILPNEKSKKPLKDFAVSVDSVEHETGIDFFPMLPDSVETKLESKIDLQEWDFKK